MLTLITLPAVWCVFTISKSLCPKKCPANSFYLAPLAKPQKLILAKPNQLVLLGTANWPKFFLGWWKVLGLRAISPIIPPCHSCHPINCTMLSLMKLPSGVEQGFTLWMGLKHTRGQLRNLGNLYQTSWTLRSSKSSSQLHCRTFEEKRLDQKALLRTASHSPLLEFILQVLLIKFTIN